MKKTMREKLQKQTVRQFLRAFLLLIGLFLGTGTPKMQARAAQTVVSHGNLVYEGKQGNASLYAADILLLEEKISTIPERCFDPVDYAHTCYWKYDRIDEGTHILTYEASDEVSRHDLHVPSGTADTSDEPETKETFETPEIPDEPETEETPEAPEIPDEPEMEERPETPEIPDEPETEGIPETGDTFDVSESTE